MPAKKLLALKYILIVISIFYTLSLFSSGVVYGQGRYQIDPETTSSAVQRNNSPTLQSETKKLTPLSEPTFQINVLDDKTSSENLTTKSESAKYFSCGFPWSFCSVGIYLLLLAILIAVISFFVLYRRKKSTNLANNIK